MGKNLRVKDICILGPQVAADTRHLLYYRTRRLGALVSKWHFSVILAIIFLSNVSKKSFWEPICSLPVPFATFICLWGEAETSVVFGRTCHGVTFLQAEKLTW